MHFGAKLQAFKEKARHLVVWLIPLLCENVFTLGLWPEINIYCVNTRRQYFACLCSALDWVIVRNATKHIDVSVICPALVRYYASKNVAESQVGNVNVSLPTNITVTRGKQPAIVLGGARVNSKPTSL